MEPPVLPADDDLIPPAEPRTVYRTAAVGVGACAAAAALGLAAGDSDVSLVHTGRLVLVALGTLIAGCALSMRPSLPFAWAIAAAAFLLAVPGLPGHWDSARMLATVATGLAGAGAILTALPTGPRFSLLSLAVVYHFGGIFTATTWPDPTPWLTNQVAHRVYMPYLSFLYLRNAYHFYSPEPGPASLLACLLQYEEDDPAGGKPKVKYEWITLPRRDEHMKDPLGQSYYRRLSITEMISPSIPGLFNVENFENLDARQRRARAGVSAVGSSKEPIPIDSSDEPAANQYRVPQPHVSRYLLPSYAKHLADEFSAPGRRVVSVKLYRFEHRITPTYQFAAGTDPYHPRTYRVYFFGEYDATGKLLNPQDEMLYWLVPIAPRPGGPSPDDPDRKDFIDYLSKHAGYEFDWRRMRP